MREIRPIIRKVKPGNIRPGLTAWSNPTMDDPNFQYLIRPEFNYESNFTCFLKFKLEKRPENTPT